MKTRFQSLFLVAACALAASSANATVVVNDSFNLLGLANGASLSFLQGSLNCMFANRVVGGRWESKAVPF